MGIGFLFPGQGSQYVGMGKNVYENNNKAKELFDKADELLGFSLTGLCFNGPEEELKKTKNTQPAILTHSIAILEILIEKGINPDVVAGHSVGEYSALVAAGSLEFSDAVKLVRFRGELMEKAKSGTMLAVLGLSVDEVKDVCARSFDDGVVEPANFNSPGQIVLSGDTKAIEKAIEVIRTLGKGKAIPLSVSGAFHSSLMKYAETELVEYLKKVKVSDPVVRIIANVSADYVNSAEDIKVSLSKQISSSVRWEETIIRMLNDGIDKFVEVGPGKVLSGLIKRIKRDAFVMNVEDTVSLNKALETLGG